MITIIVAMSRNRAIGQKGKLPWHLPNDLRFFKQKTEGNVVIMGRKTFDSIGKRALPRRQNIIVTSQVNYTANGAQIVHSLQDAIKKANHDQEIYIAGGGQIYKEALGIADQILLTLVEADLDGDTFFPEFSLNQWQLKEDRAFGIDEKHKFSYRFQTYVRKH